MMKSDHGVPGHLDPVETSTSAARVREIRQRMAVLSEPFRASYLDWFKRLGAEAVDDADVQPMLDAAVAEMETLQARYRAGHIGEPGLAYGREQIRGLLERATAQPLVTVETKRQVGHLITGVFQRQLLSMPGRYTQDWFSYHESHWLRHFGHLAGKPGLQALEVGSFEGRSACWTVQHLLTGDGSRLTCVEPFRQYEEQERNFDDNVRLAGCGDKIIKLRGTSQQVLPLIPRSSCDFVYVDGSHEVLDVLQDAAMCWQLLRPEGVLIFDDYEHALFPDSYGMSAGPAIRAFLALLPGEYTLLFQDWQVAVLKRGEEALSG